MEKTKLSVTQQLAYTDAVTYLEALLASFRAGQIVVEQDGEFVTLSPREHVEVTVEAKAKKDKQKFSLELAWTYPPAVEKASVSISPDVPQIPAEPSLDVPCACGQMPCICFEVPCADAGPAAQEDSASSEVAATPEPPASQESRSSVPVQEAQTADNADTPATKTTPRRTGTGTARKGNRKKGTPAKGGRKGAATKATAAQTPSAKTA